MKSLLKTCLAATASLLVLTTPSATANDAAPAGPEKWDPNYEPPRMPDGTPSFDGVWSKASLTVLERTPQFDELVISPAAAQAIESGRAQAMEAANRPSDPDAGAPPAGSNPGGYNSFWTDPGTSIGVVNGEYRSSWIVDPADGKIPYSEAGRKEAMDARTEMRENFSNPEVRSAGERCTVGFGSTGAPPMLNVLYNNHVQFFQAPEVVSILVEMNHNARMVRMNADYREGENYQWLGDSIGRWEGDTLVVTTTNVHPQNSVRSAIRHYVYLQPDSVVEERFTRVADDTMLYEFTVTDPDLFTQPWKGEMPLWKTDEQIYEYACHEGNHALPGILAGARRKEAIAAEEAANASAGSR
ncbi:MAG: hypothetical protein CMK09_02855 [Ponticaulis sp.]|nr:hypothetical protein [Ponticaulis sp.]|tara:strand:+ start:3463 stop:4533 length:1071 start_codon:yes stop_codon:yes gene_type:complete